MEVGKEVMDKKRRRKCSQKWDARISFSASLPDDVCGVFADSICAVKYSVDPFVDLRESILEMIQDLGVQDWEEMEELIYCYIVLNSPENHVNLNTAQLLQLGQAERISAAELCNNGAGPLRSLGAEYWMQSFRALKDLLPTKRSLFFRYSMPYPRLASTPTFEHSYATLILPLPCVSMLLQQGGLVGTTVALKRGPADSGITGVDNSAAEGKLLGSLFFPHRNEYNPTIIRHIPIMLQSKIPHANEKRLLNSTFFVLIFHWTYLRSNLDQCSKKDSFKDSYKKEC
ncbi:Ovate protein family, C-terminal [Dillenia turbinata]|uniref:Transcription repressor n=1 Tax=Dillenia turbinata TaxID=194707 RepID=A0AAN8ZJL1_9MAGN